MTVEFNGITNVSLKHGKKFLTFFAVMSINSPRSYPSIVCSS